MLEDFKNKKFDVVVLAGQSNASGSGFGAPEDAFNGNPHVFSLINDYSADVKTTAYGNEYLDIKHTDDYNIKPSAEFIESDRKELGSKGTFAFFFAEEYVKNRLEKGRDLLIVETAIGGTGFAKNHWKVGDPLYERMLKMTDMALSLNPENRLVCVLWHQGEHDSWENPQFNDKERYDFYYENLSATLKGFRVKFGVVPFIAAGFTKEWYDEYTRQCEAVYTATEKVFEENPCCRFIRDTLDLDCNKDAVGIEDTVHFCKKSLKTLGARYYRAFEELSAK
ncbi:MAG: hypothetical protein IJU83_03550 [Clostridia bacterium]|nr:hypothetical protein [Clostridia bacterium]